MVPVESAEPGEIPGELKSSTTALLMEGLRRIDEAERSSGPGDGSGPSAAGADEIMGEALG